MTLGRCPLSIFCIRGTLAEPLILSLCANQLRSWSANRRLHDAHAPVALTSVFVFITSKLVVMTSEYVVISSKLVVMSSVFVLTVGELSSVNIH